MAGTRTKTRRPSRAKKAVAEPPEQLLSHNGKLVLDTWGVPYVNQSKTDSQVSKEQSEINLRRLMELRMQRSMGQTPTSICIHYAKLWDLSPLTVRGYLHVATIWQRELTEKSPVEAKADSLNYWEIERAIASRDREKSDAFIRESEELLASSRKLLEEARAAKSPELAQKAIDLAQRARDLKKIGGEMKGRISVIAHEIRDRLDKIEGVYAPIKVEAHHTGNIQVEHQMQPISMEEILQAVVQHCVDNPGALESIIQGVHQKNIELLGGPINGELVHAGTEGSNS